MSVHMLGHKHIRIFKTFLLVTGILFPARHFVFADVMSSANYKVQADTLSIGGARSTSTNYVVEDTLGDAATGEDLTSANYKGCVGYQCFQGTPYLSFSVREGTSTPGTAGAGVALGTLSTGSVTTSNGTSINSIFVTVESNAAGGAVVTARDAYAGIKRTSTADLIDAVSATLVAGTEGYGICVFSNTQHAESPTTLGASAPYNGTCTKTTGHAVGTLTTSPQTILSSPGALKGGSAEVLVKAAISATTVSGSDYSDTITLIATGTY